MFNAFIVMFSMLLINKISLLILRQKLLFGSHP